MYDQVNLRNITYQLYNFYTFSLQIHSFACGAVVNVERREGPKSCEDRSGQTNHWNRDPLVVGKRPNPTLSFL